MRLKFQKTGIEYVSDTDKELTNSENRSLTLK